MSFLKKLFGGDSGDAGGPGKVLGETEHAGFTIRAIEMKVGSEFQLCGEIAKDIGGEMKVHKFIRADRLMSADLAKDAAISKGKQIIAEQGEGVFS